MGVSRKTRMRPPANEPEARTRCSFAEIAGKAVDLRVASFERSLDLRWRRTSYSGITAAAHDGQVGSEPEQPGTTDEPGVAVDTDLGDAAGDAPAPVIERVRS